MLFIFKYNIEIYSLHSLSPLRRQVIMESTDSLVSQASSLPPKIVENPDYLPPALPPKRHRTNIKLNNLNITPPSSPKFMVSESIESPAASTNDLSSQNNNNSLIGNNNRNMMSTKLEQRPPPTSPSSNYVQISTSTINAAAAAAAETAKQSNGEPTVQPPRAAVVVIPAATTATATKTAAPQPPPPTSPSAPISNKTPIVNNVTDVKCSAVNNDVRVIYTNVNNLFTNTTNNRSADNAQHYMQMYDGCANDRSKSNVFATKIDCDDTNSAITANKENDRCPVQKNSSQTINNNNNKNKNNSNHSINNDKNVDDEEDIVVLRRPQASSNSSLKVLISLNPFNDFFMLLENILTFGLIYRNLVLRTQNHMLSCVISMRTKIFN